MDYGVMHGRSMASIKEMDFFEYYNRTEGDPEKELINPCGESFTYRTLNLTVQKISQNFFNTRKAESGDTVAIILPNGCNRIAAILAMAKLGISFCPLEESTPEKKLVFMLTHIKVKCVITDDQFESKSRWENLLEINKIDIKTLLTDTGTVIDNYVSNVRRDSIFCILFTSGSTGMPKAVKITHGNMIQTVEWFRTDFSFEKNEMMCSKTSFIFIDYFTETLSALCMKESCLFLRPDQVQNVKVFLEHLRKYKVTRLYLSVSLLRSLLLLIEKDSENEYELNIREVWSSGEDLNQTLVNAFYKLFPRLTLWNVYGSSETCGNSMYSKMLPINIGDSSNETCIGETILPEVIIYLVDANGNLINNSLEMGEIWVSGSIVSPGYLFNNDESNKHFRVNPFYKTNDVTNEKFKTVYKTGDFAVRREKGIYKVGRNKDFVKIRGNKVNIAEIEKTIQSHYPNKSVGVVTRQVNDVTELFCFISPPTSVNCVFKLLSSKLMSFMIPKILFLDALPKTDGSDKIDRQKLVTLIPSNKCDFLTQEEILSKPIKNQFEYITELVLNTDISAIDMGRSFFELGGDSVNVWIYIEKLKTIGIETTFEEISLAPLNVLLNKFNKNSDVVSILRENKMKVFDFSEAHDDVVEILFKQHSHAFMETDPITMHLADPNYPKLFRCYMNTVVGSFPQCSFYAMFCEKPVGLAISYPLTAALEINFIPFLHELLSLYEKEVEKKLPSCKFKVLDFSTIHADTTLPRETACQVIFELSKRVVEFAIEYKFDAVCTLNSSYATMNIDTRLLGFKHLSTINLSKINVNGEYPCRNLKLKESFVCINYISEEAKKCYAEQL